jgi:hypothetical protein
MVDCGKLATAVTLQVTGVALTAVGLYPVFLLKTKDLARLSEAGAAWQEKKSNLLRPI